MRLPEFSVFRNKARAIMDRSPIPVITILVLVWMAAAVLLTLAVLRQRDFTRLKEGAPAPFTSYAVIDFSYVDTAATRAARDEARNNVREFFVVSAERSREIGIDFEQFWQRSAYQQTRPELVKFVSDKQNLKNFRLKMANDIECGILGSDLPAGKELYVFDASGRKLDMTRPPSVEQIIARWLTDINDPVLRDLFKQAMSKILAGGNLVYDSGRTTMARDEAVAAIPEVMKNCKRGELIVNRGEKVTPEIAEKLKAEQASLPQNFGVAIFYSRLTISFVVLLLGLFFLYLSYPGFFRSPEPAIITGSIIIVALLINFVVISYFFSAFDKGSFSNYRMLFLMVPIPLCAALCTVFLGNRSALFCIFMVSSATALMSYPDLAFEQTLRFFFTGGLVSLAVRNVRNYRSFFFQVLLIGVLSITLVNSDMILSAGKPALKESLLIVAANCFGCAVASLLLVFAIELVFNADSRMSLMVLCDHSHPLLDQLKRNAPGTMFHSMNVATLAEDAALAIKANPLKAKAGALFHDIGKLVNPQYFVENNVDSPGEYEKLPPKKSASIIRDHVIDGLVLGRKYRLSRYLLTAIATHHGDDRVSFFYRKALDARAENPDLPPVLERDFRYGGEVPNSRELTIISLADACEAACRSLNKPSAEKIKEMVENIFTHRFKQEQLRNSRLTLQELYIVKHCFIKDLVSFNHGRIAYAKEKNDDKTEQSVVLPQQKSSGQK